MRWEQRLLDLVDDLEQQADGLAFGERDAELVELRRAEYAQVDLSARLHGSIGAEVRLEVVGVGALEGTLAGAGEGWLLLAAHQEWFVELRAVLGLRGLTARSVPPNARPLSARLGLVSALRRAAEGRDEVVLHRRDGSVVRGLVGRVGADFVEVSGGPGVEVVPTAVLAAVRRG